MILRRYILKFREHMKGLGYSERTLDDYPANLKFFERYLENAGVTELKQITKNVIEGYQKTLLVHEPKLALETQYTRMTPVKSLFRYLYRTNQTFYDPTVGILLPKRKKNLPQDILTIREAKKLLKQPNPDTPLGLRDKAILELVYSTGIRNEELRNLTIYDVDTVNNSVMVRQGKNNKDRVVPLGEIAANYVDEYVRRIRPQLVKEKDIALLFVSKNGLAINAGNLIWIVRKYIRKAKIKKKITPHPIRHSIATHLMKNGMDIRYVQKFLGHKSIETTLIYTHVEISDLKKVHRRCHPRERG